ncbi:uncharacterized protein PITG_13709 [Phytophthora infestans T30-4]|uniref:PiggyBac transposable element-derived protein domain-containing protein n=1 Tax=Phytophthora infestans (strain T30-4) TaxID=403677 RepID=D0NML3_PHYIT|nr:uncharacterized protein PITG_13709 [Phytophthora infestans T30-4]EEY61770.1 conserved hypothetical protein [Phytophthora infestans T30-4]|eukprot:XP_002899410.1 conserved hypothetical protein [Phytophthora infestans T30-4]
MEGLRKEQLFGPTDGDDVNVVAGQDASDSDSDADNEDVMNANEVVLVVEGVEDLEDVSLNDDIPEEGLFDLTSGDLRDIAENGWITYAEAESGNLWMDAATDYYDGPCGPTRSAVAYADSPLTMFFYFLPKELWIRVADETNRYREQNIGAVALSPKLRKFKRIQAHEILHTGSPTTGELKKMEPFHAGCSLAS